MGSCCFSPQQRQTPPSQEISAVSFVVCCDFVVFPGSPLPVDLSPQSCTGEAFPSQSRAGTLPWGSLSFQSCHTPTLPCGPLLYPSLLFTGPCYVARLTANSLSAILLFPTNAPHTNLQVVILRCALAALQLATSRINFLFFPSNFTVLVTAYCVTGKTALFQ